MSGAARLAVAGVLAQVASLAPLGWALAGGAELPADVWRGAAALGLAGAGLAAGALAWGLSKALAR